MLDFILTSSPVHLLLQDRDHGEIAKGMRIKANVPRDDRGSRGLAIGSQALVAQFQADAGLAAGHRVMKTYDDRHVLRKDAAACGVNFTHGTAALRAENVAFPAVSV